MSFIELVNVKCVLGRNEARTEVLKNLSFKVDKNEVIAITGESGSGKSTLLNVLAGLETIEEGKVYIDGICISELSSRKKSDFRLKKIGFVFQNYNLISSLSVKDNILLPLLMNGGKKRSDWYRQLIETLGVSKIENKKPAQLSGGQCQRASIARALINNPGIILADEPTGNLDSKNSDEVFSLLIGSARKYNQTLIYVTHNLEKAALADRIVCVADGEICEKQNKGNIKRFLE